MLLFDIDCPVWGMEWLLHMTKFLLNNMISLGVNTDDHSDDSRTSPVSAYSRISIYKNLVGNYM